MRVKAGVQGSKYLTAFAEQCGIPIAQVNPASIDLTLAPVIRQQRWDGNTSPPQLETRVVDLSTYPDGYWIEPGWAVLCESREVLQMPHNLVGQFNLKSSRGREFFQHCLSGYIDNGFTGSLILEIYAPVIPIKVYDGLKIGQVVFTSVANVGFTYGEKNGAHYQGQRGLVGSWQDPYAPKEGK